MSLSPNTKPIPVLILNGSLSERVMPSNSVRTVMSAYFSFTLHRLRNLATEKRQAFGVGVSVMFNDFVVIGTPDMKAKFAGKSIAEVFKIIETEQIKFVSFYDKSGTHTKKKGFGKQL